MYQDKQVLYIFMWERYYIDIRKLYTNNITQKFQYILEEKQKNVWLSIAEFANLTTNNSGKQNQMDVLSKEIALDWIASSMDDKNNIFLSKKKKGLA